MWHQNSFYDFLTKNSWFKWCILNSKFFWYFPQQRINYAKPTHHLQDGFKFSWMFQNQYSAYTTTIYKWIFFFNCSATLLIVHIAVYFDIWWLKCCKTTTWVKWNLLYKKRKWLPVYVNTFKCSSVTPKSERNWLGIKFIFSLNSKVF